jgi:hypothetical protein
LAVAFTAPDQSRATQKVNGKPWSMLYVPIAASQRSMSHLRERTLDNISHRFQTEQNTKVF